MKKYLIATVFSFILLASLVSAQTCVDLTRNFGLRATDAKTGGEVSKLQQFLKDNGYYSGTIGGTFGNLTKTAVKAYQRAKKLPVTGSIGALTRKALTCGQGNIDDQGWNKFLGPDFEISYPGEFAYKMVNPVKGCLESFSLTFGEKFLGYKGNEGSSIIPRFLFKTSCFSDNSLNYLTTGQSIEDWFQENFSLLGEKIILTTIGTNNYSAVHIRNDNTEPRAGACPDDSYYFAGSDGRVYIISIIHYDNFSSNTNFCQYDQNKEKWQIYKKMLSSVKLDKKANSNAEQIYRNEKYGFELKLPEGVKIEAGSNFIKLNGGGISDIYPAGISIESNSDNLSLEEFKQKVEIDPYMETNLTSINGQPALGWASRENDLGRTTVIHNNFIFTFSGIWRLCSSLSKDGICKNEVRLLDNFRFLK